MAVTSLAAAYLFFGGIGAGVFFVSAVCEQVLLSSPGLQRYIKLSSCYTATCVLLALGVCCLVFDLGRPEQALLVFFAPAFSYLAIGAYLLIGLFACSFVLLILLFRGSGSLRINTSRRVLIFTGMMLALGVMAYTGLLLRSLSPVRLWVSWWLPVLFLASSLAAGLALFMLCARLVDASLHISHGFGIPLAIIDLIVIAFEVIACVFLLLDASTSTSGAQSILQLLAGDYAALFIGGFVVCGVMIPAVLDALVIKGYTFDSVIIVGAVCAIVGCFCLRLSLVFAGVFVGV